LAEDAVFLHSQRGGTIANSSALYGTPNQVQPRTSAWSMIFIYTYTHMYVLAGRENPSSWFRLIAITLRWYWCPSLPSLLVEV